MFYCDPLCDYKFELVELKFVYRRTQRVMGKSSGTPSLAPSYFSENLLLNLPFVSSCYGALTSEFFTLKRL